MMGFVSSFAGGASLAVRARSSLAGRAVSVPPAASVRVARWSMVKSKSMPFMEAPPALDGTMAGGTLIARVWGLAKEGADLVHVPCMACNECGWAMCLPACGGQALLLLVGSVIYLRRIASRWLLSKQGCRSAH